ncbi:anaerobic ribonucleoside-triphosphate reductase activating protein [uncultured Thiodictyon sp.]|jgi:pyruvate formate lyase activating enzyme|uniref:anaerobic ribonucleoside-triphosphate reductase activating protein n=1 Tax=uncultured Thiodictyon sp. TaxID=1846217 RepID=UPI0025E98D91|nr:anaerobic ribonucleoside-triphosphate reductase activating protein [uncultured Thiodictyon sp.]
MGIAQSPSMTGAAPVPPASARRELRVGGLIPLTTVDYPGELAAVVFCQGCPWRCRYCHNAHLLPPRAAGLIPWAQVRAFLEGRRGLLDAVVFSGGEPTLQPALGAAMTQARALGFKVGLHSSGAYPARIEALLPLLDWVGLDIKALSADYPTITGVPGSGERAWASLRLLLAAGVPLQVRTTPMPGRDRPADLAPLRERLAALGVREHRVQPCRTGHTLDPTLAAELARVL